jgi:hypothetical protein
MDTAMAHDAEGGVTGSKFAATMVTFRELFAVAVFLGLVNLFANYLLSPFFGIYEDDYTLFLPSQTWRSHDIIGYLQWCFTEAPQGRPIGWAINGLLGYVTRGHSLEPAYVIGWLILTLNAVLLYVVLKRASNWFGASIGSVVYLVLPVDVSKVILMHRSYVHSSMTFLLIGLVLYTTGKLRWKIVGFICAIFSLTIWEGFFIPFLVAPFLAPGSTKKKLQGFLWHSLVFALVICAFLVVRYFSGEQRVTAMAAGGIEMFKRMLYVLFVGPATGVLTFVLRPIEVFCFADAFPKMVGIFLFCLVVAYFLISRVRLNNYAEQGTQKAVFLGVAAVISVVSPYILMYRSDYFPANVTTGRLTCCHAPAAFGYASLAAVTAYVAWLVFKNFRPLVVFVFSAYLCFLVAFGVHVQAAEYVEGWNDQLFLWRRIIAQCADAGEGNTILLDVTGLPASQSFGALWLTAAAAGDTLHRFAEFPSEWKTFPEVNVYYTQCEYELKGDDLLLKSPSWAEKRWSTIKDGNFIFLRFEGGDLRRVNEPVTLFGKQFSPKAPEEKPPLVLTRLGQTILGTKTSLNWRWFGKPLFYPKP